MVAIAAIILAAGQSLRMGCNKLLLKVGDKPLVRRVAENVLSSRANPVLVVAGYDSDNLKHALAGCVITTVQNPDFRSGLSSSIRAGVGALPDGSDGALIVLGDMPGVSSSLINCMIGAFPAERGNAICVAARDGTRGNPVLFGRCFFPDLLALTGDEGAKRVIAANEGSVLTIEAHDDGPLLDIDTPEALADFLSRTK